MGFFSFNKKPADNGTAAAQKAEVFNRISHECAYRYEMLIAQLNHVYQTAVSPEEKNKHPFAQVMEQVDVYLQSILLGLAMSDNTITNEEIELVNKITKYGNIFRSANIDVAKTDFNGAVMRQRIHMVAQTCSKMVPCIFNIIAELDRKTKSDRFNEIAPKFVELLCFFCGTDGSMSAAEKNKVRELTEPLFKLFPYSKAKL